jgi:PAS domain S-box-containing protein
LESTKSPDIHSERVTENQFLRRFLNLSSNGGALANEENIIVEWNPILENVTGVSREQALGKDILKVITNLVPTGQHTLVESYLDQVRREKSPPSLKTTLQHLNGRCTSVLLQIFPIITEKGICMGVIITALSEQEQTQGSYTERTLEQNDKLVLLGELATGIAQEINSPLQIITGISESIIERVKRISTSSLESSAEVITLFEEGRLLRQLEMMNRCAWRVAENVKALTTYGGTTSEGLNPYDLNAVVKNARLLIESQLRMRSNIDFIIELMPNLPMISCNPGQVEQLLVRLVINASDSLFDGGKIIIRTGMGYPRSPRVSSSMRQEDMRVYLQVSDTGKGIPKDMHSRVFDLFAPADSKERKMRLCLAVVAAIARLHGAEITMESGEKEGTTFTVYFQRMKETHHS